MNCSKLPVLTLLLAGGWVTPPTATWAAEFKDAKEKLNYAIGVNYAASLKKGGVDVDPETFIRGFRDQVSSKAQMTEMEAREVLIAFQREQRAKQEEARKAQGEKNKKEGDAFLEANKTKEGVVVLPSGLQYKVLAAGAGDSPKATDTVTVNYKGTLIDGTEFDSSYKRGQPATFGVTGVIKGWTEALQLMKPGAKWQLFIPSQLAYGERGMSQAIGPDAVLLFEVELLSIKVAAPPAPPQPVTSDIIKVPSKEELEKGAKIEVIKASDLEKLKAAEKEKADKEKPKN